MSIKERLEGYPDISFTDNKTLENVQTEMINDYLKKYQELTGSEKDLSEADPDVSILYAAAMQLYQLYAYVDFMGKQNFLKYATGDYLENLGALKGVARNDGTAAKVIIKFVAEKDMDVTIPAGTMVTAGDDVYFYTEESKTIKSGEESTEITATCDRIGVAGNEYEVGIINQLVNSIPFVSAAANIEKPHGGREKEDDASLADKIYYAPEGYSTAGSEGSYKYWVKQADSTIIEVQVTSPEPTSINIRYLKENGEIPTETECMEVKEYLTTGGDKVPTTDNITVEPPTVVPYVIDLTYYINKSDANKEKTIQEAVEAAVEYYKLWQKSKIGRDINPSFLITKIITAGAKRAELTNPLYKKISDVAIAAANEVNIVYGGLEDD